MKYITQAQFHRHYHHYRYVTMYLQLIVDNYR